MLLFVLVPGAVCAQPAVPTRPSGDSIVNSLELSPGANCSSDASVRWNFSYSTPPTAEFGSVTNAKGTVIGAFDSKSQLPSLPDTWFGTWVSKIQLVQEPGTLIGTYGGAGDPGSPANTAEYFILYNCTTRQVLYKCSGTGGTCPKTAPQALDILYPKVPVDGGPLLVAIALLLAGSAAWHLRRQRATARRT